MVMHTPDSVTMHAAFVEFGRVNKNEFIDDPGFNVGEDISDNTFRIASSPSPKIPTIPSGSFSMS